MKNNWKTMDVTGQRLSEKRFDIDIKHTPRFGQKILEIQLCY